MASTTPSDYTQVHYENDKSSQNYYVRRNIVPPKELPGLDIEPVDNGCAAIPRFDFLLSFHTIKSNKNPLIITESEAPEKQVDLELHGIGSQEFSNMTFNGEKKAEIVLPNDQLIQEYANYFEDAKHNPFESLISKVYENITKSEAEHQTPDIRVSNLPPKTNEVNDAVHELAALQGKYDQDVLKQAIKIAFPDNTDASSELEALAKEHTKLKEIHLTLLKSLIEEKKTSSEIIVTLKQQNAKLAQEYLSAKSERDLMKQSKENDSETKTAAISQQPADESIFDKQGDNDSDYEYEPIGETIEEVELVLPKEHFEAPTTNIKAEKNYINQTPKSLADAFDVHHENVVRKEPLIDIKQSDMSDDRFAQENTIPVYEHHPYNAPFPPVIHANQNFTKIHQQFYEQSSNEPVVPIQVHYESPYVVQKPIEQQAQKFAVFENHIPTQGVTYRYSPVFQNQIAHPVNQPLVHNEAVTILNREPVPIIRPIDGQQFKPTMSHSVERKNKVTRISLNDYLNTIKTTPAVTQVVPEKPVVQFPYTNALPVAREPVHIQVQETIPRMPYQTMPVQMTVNPGPVQVTQPQVWRPPQLQSDSDRNTQGMNPVAWVNQPRHTFGVPSELTYQPFNNFNRPNNFENAEKSQQLEDIDQLKRRSAQPRLETPDPKNIYFAYELYSSEQPDQQSGRFINTVSTH